MDSSGARENVTEESAGPAHVGQAIFRLNLLKWRLFVSTF
jgi:hypothetical protein